MMDFATGSYYQRTRRKPARRWFFLSGIAIGLVWGAVLVTAIRDTQAKSAKPAGWNSAAFAYVGFEDGRRFIQNHSGRDYRLDPGQCLVFKLGPLGLVSTDSKPEPTFIPAGSAAGISFNPALEGELVLFDMAGKLRIDLK